MRTNRWTAAALVALTALTVTSARAQERPALVVLITVDQLRGDYIDRFAANLAGGLERFRTAGAYYPDGRQDHAMTSTAPGHATLLSGRVPARTGILSNTLGVPDPAHRLIAGATAAGASPWRFRGTTLYDWLRAAHPQMRALSISRKDRGAILPIGNARTAVYWWANERFTTSNYYADTLPSWLSAWNAAFRPADFVGREWTLLLPDAAYPEPDDEAYEGVGARRGRTFPHRLANIGQLINFPWMDSLVLAAALRGTRALELGTRGTTDLLAVSLSTLDAVGHAFGPDSREVHDQVVRVDRWLGTFMQQLEQIVPRERIIYVLSSDHGVASMPQRAAARGEPDAGRVGIAPTVNAVLRPLQDRFGYGLGISIQSGVVLADTAALRARGVDVAALGDTLAARVSQLPGIARVFTPRTLAVAPPADAVAGLWRRAIPPSYAWLIAAEPRPNWNLGTSLEAEHGTPLVANQHVPIAFMGAGIAAARVTRTVRTVDIAPTLAALLGVSPLEPLDGVPLPEVSGPRR